MTVLPAVDHDAAGTVVRLREHGYSAPAVAISAAAAAALRESRLVDVVPNVAGGWDLQPSRRIGVVRVHDDKILDGRATVTVHVEPKVPIDRVMFLLEHRPQVGKDHVDWQPHDVGVAQADDLLSVIATVFVRAAERSTRSGLLQGYVTVEESLTVLRGRVREADQVRVRYGRAFPIEVRYDDYTADIAENRILSAAVRRLLRVLPAGHPAVGSLQRLRVLFADVTDLVSGRELPRWQSTRLNARYQPALRLAEVVLAGASFDHRLGNLNVRGFVLDMSVVFENFLTATLGAALVRVEGGSVTAQYQTHLDENDEIEVKPDIVWSDGGRPRAVVDAKYKAEKPAGFPQADLYQALAYATTLRLPEAHLVYAKGEEAVREHAVRGVDIRLTIHVLDLVLPPADLLSAVEDLAARVSAGAT